MMLPIAELTMPHYSERTAHLEPTSEEIKTAIETNHLEARGYQSHADELGLEWRNKSRGGTRVEEWVRLARQYHGRRIAYFVVHGWDDPITVNAKNEVMDGTHRFRAAKYRGEETIEAVFESS